MRPLQISCRPPHELVTRRQGIIGRVPRELAVIADLLNGCALAGGGEADDLGDGHVARHGGCVGRAPHARQVDLCDARGVLEVDEFQQIAVHQPVLRARVLVLVREVLDGFREAHGREALREEGLMVTATCEVYHVRRTLVGHLASEGVGTHEDIYPSDR